MLYGIVIYKWTQNCKQKAKVPKQKGDIHTVYQLYIYIYKYFNIYINNLEEFWNELSECVGSFGRNESVVVLGDFNARVGNEVIEGIVGRHGVPGRNESGERLLEMCAEQELVVCSSWFKKNDVYKYTWLRMTEGRVVDKALMDYVLLPRRMLGRLLDVKVWRGEGGGIV